MPSQKGKSRFAKGKVTIRKRESRDSQFELQEAVNVSNFPKEQSNANAPTAFCILKR